MIAAAKADGQIDVQESQAIPNQINSLALPAEDKALLFEDSGRLLDITGLAAAVASPEQAAKCSQKRASADVAVVRAVNMCYRQHRSSRVRELYAERGITQALGRTCYTESMRSVLGRFRLAHPTDILFS